MGSTLEAQKKKAPTPKKRVVVTPDKPYYSSKSLGKGFEQRLPSAISSAQFRGSSPFGKASPRAALQDVVASGINLFRDKEGKRGSRLAEMAAPKILERSLKRNDGGMARKTRVF